MASEHVLWDELAAPLPATTALSGGTTTQVCVVGLGGSGLAALGELARRGVDAVGVDAGPVAAGAAGRNGGFLLAGLAAFHHDAVRRLGQERAVACYRATAREIEAMAAETPRAVCHTGSLRIAVDDAELEDCDAQLARMQEDGLAAERYSGREGEGLLFPHDCALQPAERCREIAQRLLANGVRLATGTRVVGLRPGAVCTELGDICCDAALVCVDGGLEQLLPELEGIVRSARLQMLGTAPDTTARLERPVYRRYGYDYCQQLPGGEIVAGGGRDLGGAAEWTSERGTTVTIQGAIERFARAVSGSAAQVTHRWSGIVGYTSTGLPLVRRLPSGVFVAGGYSGTGNVIGRIAGRALVELALEEESPEAELFDCGEAL